jgi:hypothetical protein
MTSNSPTEERQQPDNAAVDVLDQLDRYRSRGRTKLGIPVFYVRPKEACENRSRKFVGYHKMNKGIERWFAPEVKYFLVDGHLIGSNNPKNALREYHRICEKEKIGRQFEVNPITTKP